MTPLEINYIASDVDIDTQTLRLGSSVRFRVVTCYRRNSVKQFIHTVTAEAPTLPLGDVWELTLPEGTCGHSH